LLEIIVNTGNTLLMNIMMEVTSSVTFVP